MLADYLGECQNRKSNKKKREKERRLWRGPDHIFRRPTERSVGNWKDGESKIGNRHKRRWDRRKEARGRTAGNWSKASVQKASPGKEEPKTILCFGESNFNMERFNKKGERRRREVRSCRRTIRELKK